MPDNRDIITAVFNATAKGDGRPYGEAMADDMQWRTIGSTSWSGTFEGGQAVRDMLGALRQRLEGRNTCVPTRILADGDFVVVQARGENRTKDEKEYRNDYCFVIRMRDGKMASVEEYCDTELITSALGPGPRAIAAN